MSEEMTERAHEIWKIARRLTWEDEKPGFLDRIGFGKTDLPYLIDVLGDAIAEYHKMKPPRPAVCVGIDGAALRVTYRSRGKEPAQRDLDPSELSGYYDRRGVPCYTHMKAFCHDSGMMKTFLLESILEAWNGDDGSKIELADIPRFLLENSESD